VSRQRTGYLVLADISGYTAFLTGTEVEHAQEIIEDLMKAILRAMSAPFQLVKLEGDAAFFHVADETISAERVLEAIESCYVAFHDRVLDVKQATTCTCKACGSMTDLDLKFFAHHGAYLLQHLAGTTDLAGPAVILVHRLLKNNVVERTGIKAYALLTGACVERLPARPPALVDHPESYEHLGDVPCAVHDLRSVLAAARATRTAFISDEQADFAVALDLPASPAVVWEYNLDATKANRWKQGLTITNRPSGGRMGQDAEQHCAHGASVTILHFTDVRPFRYYSYRSGDGTGAADTDGTNELVPLPDGGTRLVMRLRLIRRGVVGTVMRGMFRLLFRKRVRNDLERLRELLLAAQREPSSSGTLNGSG
jgi:hypothetical protein